MLPMKTFSFNSMSKSILGVKSILVHFASPSPIFLNLRVGEGNSRDKNMIFSQMRPNLEFKSFQFVGRFLMDQSIWFDV